MKTRIRTLLIGLSLIASTTLFAQEMPLKKENAKAKMEKLATTLQLTDTQKEQVREIMMEKRVKMDDLKSSRERLAGMEEEEANSMRNELSAKRKKIMKETNAQMQEVLNPEQLKKYRSMIQDKKKTLRENRPEGEEHRPMKQQTEGSPKG